MLKLNLRISCIAFATAIKQELLQNFNILLGSGIVLNFLFAFIISSSLKSSAVLILFKSLNSFFKRYGLTPSKHSTITSLLNCDFLARWFLRSFSDLFSRSSIIPQGLIIIISAFDKFLVKTRSLLFR